MLIMFRSTIMNLDSLNRKLYVDIKNGLNLENPITNKFVQNCANGDYLYIYKYVYIYCMYIYKFLQGTRQQMLTKFKFTRFSWIKFSLEYLTSNNFAYGIATLRDSR